MNGVQVRKVGVSRMGLESEVDGDSVRDDEGIKLEAVYGVGGRFGLWEKRTVQRRSVVCGERV